MPKVQMLKVWAGNGGAHPVGAIVDVNPALAERLIRDGAAKRVGSQQPIERSTGGPDAGPKPEVPESESETEAEAEPAAGRKKTAKKS